MSDLGRMTLGEHTLGWRSERRCNPFIGRLRGMRSFFDVWHLYSPWSCCTLGLMRNIEIRHHEAIVIIHLA